MAYIGRDLQYGVLDKQSFTANSSTTVFTLNSGVQNAKSLLVSVGAVIQEPDVAYTASGTTLTFTSAPTTGDAVYVIYLGKELSSASGRDDITVETATSAGATTLALGSSPVNAQAIMVFLNGVTQVPDSDYTVSGSTLTFTTAPDSGMAIMVYHIGKAAAMGVLADGSVTNPKIVTMDAAKLTGSLPSSMAADTTAIDQTIASLGMHVAVADNKASFNLPGVFIDQFESDTGILTETNVDRNTASEYVSSITSSEGEFTSDANTVLLVHCNDTGMTDSSSFSHATNEIAGRSSVQSKYGGFSAEADGSTTAFRVTSNDASFAFGTGEFTLECWVYWTAVGTDKCIMVNRESNASTAWYFGIDNNRHLHLAHGSAVILQSGVDFQTYLNTWTHVAVARDGNTGRIYINGVQKASSDFSSINFTQTNRPKIGGGDTQGASLFTGYFDEVRISNTCRYPSGTTFTPNMVSSVSATGTLISTASTADAATTEASGVMVYENSDGTATLGTDLKAYFSADDGANWTEAASYGSTINFNGASKKLVKLGKTTGLTSGTQMKLKAEWANQVSGTVNTSFSDSYSTGNRGSIITPSTNISVTRAITKIVDGSKANSADGFHFTGSTTLNSSHYIRFQLSVAKCFTGCRIWNDENNDGSPTHGFWKWQASNDATTWTDLGGSFELNNTLISSVPGHADFSGGLSNNTSEYTYYQMVGVSGAADSRSNWMEWEFKAGAGAVNGKETRLHGWAINY